MTSVISSEKKPLFDLVIHEQAKNRRALQKLKSHTEKLREYGIGWFRKKYFSKQQDKDVENIKNLRWYQVVDEAIDKHDFVLIIVPPGWGKTRGVTGILPVKFICENRKTRGLVLSKSSAKAKEFMKMVKSHLLRNKALQRDFGGPFFSKDLKWSEKEVEVLGLDPSQSTPTISNFGISGQIEGSRVNWIIMDDALDKETAYSPSARDKFIETLEQTVIPRLEPAPKDGTPSQRKFIFITHRFCENDGIDQLIEHPLFKDSVVMIPAVQGDGPKYQSMVPGIDIGHSTGKGRWSDEEVFLGEKSFKKTKPKHVWMAAYAGRPQPPGSCPFNFDWIAPPYMLDGKEYLNKNKLKWIDTYPQYVDIVIDPAFSDEEDDNDYSGLVAFGPHPTDPHGLIIVAMQVMWISTGHERKYAKFVKALKDRLTSTTRVHRIVVETNGAKTLGTSMRNHGLRNTQDMHSFKNKNDRISELEMPFYYYPDTPELRKNDYRFYFHNMLRLQYHKGWDMFIDEYRFWSPKSDTPEHLLDCLGSGLFELYIRKRKYSGRRTIVGRGRR